MYYFIQLKSTIPQPAALSSLTIHHQTDSWETADLELHEKYFCCQYKWIFTSWYLLQPFGRGHTGVNIGFTFEN